MKPLAIVIKDWCSLSSIKFSTVVCNMGCDAVNRFESVCRPTLQIQLTVNANGRLPFYEAKVLFSEGRGRM